MISFNRKSHVLNAVFFAAASIGAMLIPAQSAHALWIIDYQLTENCRSTSFFRVRSGKTNRIPARSLTMSRGDTVTHLDTGRRNSPAEGDFFTWHPVNGFHWCELITLNPSLDTTMDRRFVVTCAAQNCYLEGRDIERWDD